MGCRTLAQSEPENDEAPAFAGASFRTVNVGASYFKAMTLYGNSS